MCIAGLFRTLNLKPNFIIQRSYTVIQFCIVQSLRERETVRIIFTEGFVGSMREEVEITTLDLVATPMLENKEVPPQLKLIKNYREYKSLECMHCNALSITKL